MCIFVDDVRKLTDKQRSDVPRAFLGLHSPYIVRVLISKKKKNGEKSKTTARLTQRNILKTIFQY